MARVTAEERGEDLCHFSFHICGLLFGKWGGAAGGRARSVECGGRGYQLGGIKKNC